MAERHVHEACQRTGAAIKRRGILAAAGAVVAGIVAKQTGQPVAAATIATGSNPVTTYTALVAQDPPGGSYAGTSIFAVNPTSASNPAGSVVGIIAVATGTGADGIHGTGTGQYSGVAGFGGNNGGAGIFGQGGMTPGFIGAGVVGVAAGAINPGFGLQSGVYGTALGVAGGGGGARRWQYRRARQWQRLRRGWLRRYRRARCDGEIPRRDRHQGGGR